jgi:hypothetical protein
VVAMTFAKERGDRAVNAMLAIDAMVAKDDAMIAKKVVTMKRAA